MTRQDGRRKRERYVYHKLSAEGREKWLRSRDPEQRRIAQQPDALFRVYSNDVWITGLWVGLGIRRRYATDYFRTVSEVAR